MPRTRIEKLWLGGAALVAVLIAVAGYFLLVGPQRAQTAEVNSQVDNAQLQATTLQARIVSLTSQQKKLASYQAALAQAKAALPTADDLSANPGLLKSLQTIAHQSGTSVSSLTIGDPAASAAPAAPTSTSSSAASSSSASTATATTTPTVGVYSIAITASVSGTTQGLTAFLTRLQLHQPRAVLVSGVTIGSGSSATGKGTAAETMALTMTAFVRPGATSASASPSAAPSASTTP